MNNVTFPDYSKDNQTEYSDFEKMFPFFRFDAIFPGLNNRATLAAQMNMWRPSFTRECDFKAMERESIGQEVSYTGYELEQQGKYEEALNLYNLFLDHFIDDEEERVIYYIKIALLNKGEVLEKLKCPEGIY